MKTKILVTISVLLLCTACSFKKSDVKNETQNKGTTVTEQKNTDNTGGEESKHNAALDKEGVCARPTKYYFIKKGSMTNQAVLLECNEHRNTNHICKQSICSKCELTQTQSHATYRDCVGH